MLTPSENELLTRVGPGTPLGQFFRRYWIPAAKLEEVAEAGGAPVRVRLLGERLVAFRDPVGRVGLMHEFCPHRGASLVYGRNEEGGLRCIYHGWKIRQDGDVLEMPAEPSTSQFRSKVRHCAYPLREAGGLLWTYMGPHELQPPFPNFPWLDLPSTQLLVVKMFQDSNYLQGLEGDLDPAHPNYLHRDLSDDRTVSWGGAGWQSIANLMGDGAPHIECEETPYLMRVGAIRKTNDPAMRYVRTTEWVAPYYAYIATGPHESQLFKAWLPIDDNTCYTFYIHFHPTQPLDVAKIHANWGHRTEPPYYRTEHTLLNGHFQDRHRMVSGNYSGIEGAAIQDRAVQESMGPIYDRSQEHLGASDKAVIFYRRLLLRKLREMNAGSVLPGQNPALDYRQRGASCYMRFNAPWQEAVRYVEQFEQENPPAAAA